MDVVTLYGQLLTQFGPQHWWPVHEGERRNGCDPTWEILAGCILTQNTAWTNVEHAIGALYHADCLDTGALLAVPTVELEAMIRPAGYYRQKAKKLQLLARVIETAVSNEITVSIAKTVSPAKYFIDTITREHLLAVWGIGPETADSMLCYAGQRLEFVIDTYTKRFCAHYGVVFTSYHEYKTYFQAQLPRDIDVYKELHALIVRWGKIRT